jgi:hypothetical protein
MVSIFALQVIRLEGNQLGFGIVKHSHAIANLTLAMILISLQRLWPAQKASTESCEDDCPLRQCSKIEWLGTAHILTLKVPPA